jgi:class 3 adenylate cyclase/tetratricopeptide (TPR) repeat protein
VRNCSNCGYENPEVQRFCGDCGSPLEAARGRPADERKVITALFCDLVGFTATSESADPEDVSSMLAAYFALARAQIEAHGGVVEKFIGDAVVGVFGVPATHEDDPERAVRAGLRIAEDAKDLEALGGKPLRLRIGINTGVALVRLGINTASGEGFLAGDSINTASRIQSVAPEMGVAVGLGTYEATTGVFDYTELEPATVKGKVARVRIFHARSPKARLGIDLARTHDTPFVGREVDLALLEGIFASTLAADSPQLVTVVGEPGLGKSRIVAELGAHADARPELITWRQGRCLAYGEGITFWALGEILKAHAGILESDTTAVAQAKLGTVLPDGDEQAWFRQRLLPLLGIEANAPAEREELFTAWRRFLEHIARQRPTVLVFEDLHWADEAMLAFLEHLADRARDVPLLVIATARPELFERYPDFAVRLANATSIKLGPLSSEATSHLVSALLDTTMIPAELQHGILDRAGGNPLYAEEFVRLLKDKHLLVRRGSSWSLREGAEVPFPGSIQALIAARLDTLSSDAKSMLADAAVIGKVFWASAIVRMGERAPTVVTEMLQELSKKELVRPAGSSSIEGESEYAFRHVLAREVVYGQLPRASRASRHVGAARWIESRVPERVEDLADVLAYHYATALELTRAVGRIDEAVALEPIALRFLTLSGDRALGLDAPTALSHFSRALDLTPHAHPGRPLALVRLGEASVYVGRYVEAAALLEEAIQVLRARGDLAAAARAMGMLSDVCRTLGRSEWSSLAAEAVALLEPLPPGRELVEALTEEAASEVFGGRALAAAAQANRALDLAEELQLEVPARALGFRGMGRALSGDARGLADMRRALVLATDTGQGREVAVLYNNLGVAIWMFEGPRAGLHELQTGLAFARACGLTESLDFATSSTLDLLAGCGEFDEVLATAEGIAERLESSEDLADLLELRASQMGVRTMRGQPVPVEAIDWLERVARGSGDAHVLMQGLCSAVAARASLGPRDAALDLLSEVEATPGARGNQYFTISLPTLTRVALALGDRSLGHRLLVGVEPVFPYTEHALVASNAALTEADGDLETAIDAYAEATDRWERFGVVPERAFALLGQGRCLVALSRPTEAVAVLLRAHEIFERLQAAPALAETEALLASAA